MVARFLGPKKLWQKSLLCFNFFQTSNTWACQPPRYTLFEKTIFLKEKFN